MRNSLIAVILLSWAIAGRAQGIVSFNNQDFSNGLNAPIYDSDCTTKISGPQWQVRLLAGPSPVSRTPVATTGILTNAPGYFDGGVVTITNIPPGGMAYLQIQVWNTLVGATPEEAMECDCMGTYALSSVFAVATGNPEASPPDPPASLFGLTSFCVTALSPFTLPPKLGVSYTETNTLAIAWGSLYYQYVLEQSPDFSATNWTTVSNVWQLVNFRHQVTVPASTGKMFYRLRSF